MEAKIKWNPIPQFREIRETHGNPNNELMVFDWDQTLTDDWGKLKIEVILVVSEKYALSINSWSSKPYVLGLLHYWRLKDRFDTIKIQRYGKDQMMDEILTEYKEIYGVSPNKVIFVDDMETCRTQVKEKYPDIICIPPEQIWEYLN